MNDGLTEDDKELAKKAEGIVKLADEFLENLKWVYEIDGQRAANEMWLLSRINLLSKTHITTAGSIPRHPFPWDEYVSSFADRFAHVKTDYELVQHDNSEVKNLCALELVNWCNLGLAYGIIKRSNPLEQLKKASGEIESLRSQLEQMELKYSRATKQNVDDGLKIMNLQDEVIQLRGEKRGVDGGTLQGGVGPNEDEQ